MCFSLAAEAQAERKDGSHPVHVDNCILNAEALVCIKEPPAYTFRDFRCQQSSGPQGPMPCSLLQHMDAWDQLCRSPSTQSLGWKSNNTGMVTVYWENKMEKGGHGAEIAQRRAWWVLRVEGGEAGRSGVLFVRLQRRFWKAFCLGKAPLQLLAGSTWR